MFVVFHTEKSLPEIHSRLTQWCRLLCAGTGCRFTSVYKIRWLHSNWICKGKHEMVCFVSYIGDRLNAFCTTNLTAMSSPVLLYFPHLHLTVSSSHPTWLFVRVTKLHIARSFGFLLAFYHTIRTTRAFVQRLNNCMYFISFPRALLLTTPPAAQLSLSRSRTPRIFFVRISRHFLRSHFSFNTIQHTRENNLSWCL